MYKIKQVSEDFIVKEISSVNIRDNGKYTYFLLKKKDYTTLRALERIAERTKIPLKKFGFAGNKDKTAVTEQVCSVLGNIKDFELKDIEVKCLGRGDSLISLGDLKGNEFEIIVRNIDNVPEKKTIFVNYFGEQRFSKNNIGIGRAIVKKDFKKAVKLLLENKGDNEEKVRRFLEEKPTDFIGALRIMPRKILRLLIHSYQSHLWNRLARRYKNKKINLEIPLIGFGMEVGEDLQKILDEEKIKPRDFIIKEIPELSSEGTTRDLFAEAKNLEIGKPEKDELNPGKRKVKIRFKLYKGCYATEFIKQLFS